MALSTHVSVRPQQTTFFHSSFTKHNRFNFSQQFKLESYATTTTSSKRPIIIHALAPKTTEQSDFQVQSAPPNSLNGWAAFARNVSGEWDGFGAEFSKQGEPIELPESVVPEAYREWEVKVFDWQTQCPTLAHDEAAFSFMYKFIRLLPTVGCEADAATRYSIDERNISDANVEAFVYQSTGCYVAVWSNNSNSGNNNSDPFLSWELEHCLTDPRDKESRVRIVQVVRLQDSKLVLQNIKVFCEHWYGPFLNGDQLGGCAIQDSAFASTQALDPAEVIGVWEGKHAISSFDNAPQKVIQELVGGSTRKTVRDELDLVLLPRQLWSCLKDIAGGGTCCEVGWLFEKGRAMTSKCIFSDNGKLKEIAIACESAASAQ